MTQKAKNIKALGLMLGLLLAGALLGGTVVYYFVCESVSPDERTDLDGKKLGRRRKKRSRRYSAERRERLVAKFKKSLDLTKDQEEVVREALKESWDAMREIRRRIRPELQREREKTRDKIRKVLTSDQKAAYEEMIRRYEKRRAKKG